MTSKDPFLPADDSAREIAQSLLNKARFCSLGTIHPERSCPYVTRSSFLHIDGLALLLVSELSSHTKFIHKNPNVSLLIGEPENRGDPLTHPRLTLWGKASFVKEKDHFREAFLAAIPKATLYIDFADFHFVAINIEGGDLNAGFGRAYHLTPSDLTTNSQRL